MYRSLTLISDRHEFSTTASNHNAVITKEESALFNTLMSYDAIILKTKTTKSAVQTEHKVKSQHRGERQRRVCKSGSSVRGPSRLSGEKKCNYRCNSKLVKNVTPVSSRRRSYYS